MNKKIIIIVCLFLFVIFVLLGYNFFALKKQNTGGELVTPRSPVIIKTNYSTGGIVNVKYD